MLRTATIPTAAALVALAVSAPDFRAGTDPWIATRHAVSDWCHAANRPVSAVSVELWGEVTRKLMALAAETV
jgi:hypothetical protein